MLPVVSFGIGAGWDFPYNSSRMRSCAGPHHRRKEKGLDFFRHQSPSSGDHSLGSAGCSPPKPLRRAQFRGSHGSRCGDSLWITDGETSGCREQACVVWRLRTEQGPAAFGGCGPGVRGRHRETTCWSWEFSLLDSTGPPALALFHEPVKTRCLPSAFADPQTSGALRTSVQGHAQLSGTLGGLRIPLPC